MIESSRFNNQRAWFVGQSDRGDYYDHATGTYLGSWSRSQSNFIDAAKQATNLFDLDQWKDRHKPKSTGLLGNLLEKIIPRAEPIEPDQPPDPHDLPGRYIAFVGDSFCGSLHHDHYERLRRYHPVQFRGTSKKGLAWPSLVVDGMPGHHLAHYGFCGRSWWYSWQRFWRDWKDRLQQLDMVIFVHTDADRINNAIDDEIRHGTVDPLISNHDKDLAVKLYLTCIADRDFHRWCQQQYFRYIREVMPDVPQMHFFSFNLPTPKTCEILPGIKFNTPLALLSSAENRINPRQPLPVIVTDTRANHFNDHNNRAMADLVLAHTVDYKSSTQSIPYNNFYQADPRDFLPFLEFYSSRTWLWV